MVQCSLDIASRMISGVVPFNKNILVSFLPQIGITEKFLKKFKIVLEIYRKL